MPDCNAADRKDTPETAKLFAGRQRSPIAWLYQVVDDYHVLVAAHAALRAEQVGRLMSHSLTGELIFSLSPSRGIQKSVDQFGVNEDTSAVVAVLFDAPKDKVSSPPCSHPQPSAHSPVPDVRLSSFTLRVCIRLVVQAKPCCTASHAWQHIGVAECCSRSDRGGNRQRSRTRRLQ